MARTAKGAALLNNADLIAEIRCGGPTATQAREYLSRLERKSKPERCERGHAMCALVTAGPCGLAMETKGVGA
jgi:hypothetical protein